MFGVGGEGEVEVEVSAVVVRLVVVCAACRRVQTLDRCSPKCARRARLHVSGKVEFPARHAQVEAFYDGVPSAAGEEALEAGGEEGVDGGGVHWIVVGRDGGVGGAEVVESVGFVRIG